MEQLIAGQEATREFVFTDDAVGEFAELVDDHAPVHFNEGFAQSGGFATRIVHGFFVSSIFSGLLGEQLPGPDSVINTVSLKMRSPVLVGERVIYRAAVKQVAASVGAVVLTLSATKVDGTVVLSGSTTCSFPKRG